MTEFNGIWPGIVESIIDPEKACRIQVRVPQIFGPAESEEKIPTIDLPWARPCLPLVGKSSGIAVVPEIGAGVWVSFVGGDPRLPVWLGGWFGTGDSVAEHVASYLPDPKAFVLKSPLGNSLILDNGLGELSTSSKKGSSFNSAGQMTHSSVGPMASTTTGTMGLTSTGAMAISSLLTLTITALAAITLSAGAAIVITAIGAFNLLSTAVVLGVAANAKKLCNEEMISLYNTHTHNYIAPVHSAGLAPTTAPNQAAAVDTHTTINVRAS